MKKYKHPIQFQIVHHRRWVLMVGLVATIHFFCQTLMLPSYFIRMSNSDDTLEDEFHQESLQLVKTRAFDHVFIEDDSETTQEMISVDLSNNLGDGVSINSSISIDPKILMVVGEPPVVVNKSGNGSPGQALPINEKYALFQTDDVKRMRCLMPPKSVMYIDQMERLLARNRRASRAMRPRWSSPRDQEILAAKMQITKAPSRITDQELYAPVFRNVSMFKRSYELMERTLKVYVYKEGERPIFHQPILKGLYASEGWFMKLMEGNKRFVVKDPRKAHLFYMPFSARMLEHKLYVRNSHNRTNLRQFLKVYAEKLASKYPFWNRTGGADHFLVACHDWAPYETRHHMEHCMKALCNADVTTGFKIGRDISLPECYVRSARNPLRDLGGKPASERNILAFYAGNIHGYLRKILLEYWNNKDPDMKIFGPMPPGVASKMNYIEHMKSSKFCICPKGYEVNSPRVVEAIFYECVPVIISDNFVPPFFEVLNWDSFSVVVAEKDIPELKNILTGISDSKYGELQHGVKKVQRHFLWNVKGVKYDLFHMVLHSIWYNRIFQFKPRYKFCICPKGYEVNSPRVVEAIFYECVPVIISDNFVPPFFEVLNWDAFSVVVAEKDIPELKNILTGISDSKYGELQHGVKKVQRHFLWNVKGVKYDLFHMILHSIWYNRIFQFKPR
ncbi:putative xylogalacturonan beta-1,3-xylosyltransferase [Helianthus anomalus]